MIRAALPASLCEDLTMPEQYRFPDEVMNTMDPADFPEPEIEVIDDTPPDDRGRKPLDREVADPTDEELNAVSEGVRKRINELTHARHDERREKERLQREREELANATQQLWQENQRLKQAYNTGNEQFVGTVRAATDSALEVAKRQYKEAYDSGDADKLIEAQQALTAATMRAEQAKYFQPTPLQVDERPVQQVQRQPEPPPLDPNTRDWVARNKWWGQRGHEAKTSFTLGLHQELEASGVEPGSNAYFESIDSRLRSAFPDFFRPGSDSGEASRRPPPSTVVAPASRTTGVKKVRLTETQVSIAKRLGITPQQYAAELVKMERANG